MMWAGYIVKAVAKHILTYTPYPQPLQIDYEIRYIANWL